MANPDNVLKTLLQGLFISRNEPHEYIHFPNPRFERAEYPIFLLGGGQYISVGDWTNLDNSQMHHLRLTEDGKLMVDANVTVTTGATYWTDRYYEKVTVTDVDQTVAFGFTCEQMIIANDDGADAVFINYGAVAVADADHDEIKAGETFVDQFASNNVHLICEAGKTAVVRIWARAT